MAEPTPKLPLHRRGLRRRRLSPRAALAAGMAAALALGLAWRAVRYALNFPLWGDEAFVALNLMHRGFAGMLQPLEYGQIAPAGFLWAELAAVRLLGVSGYSMRLAPLACSLVGLVLFWRFAARVLDRRSALLAVAVLAASFYPVRHGAEVKPYSSDLLVGLLISMLAWRAGKGAFSAGRWVLLAAVTAGAIWLSYPAVFVAGGAGLFLAAEAWRRRSGRWAAAVAGLGAAAAGCFLATYLLYGRAQAEANPWYTQIDMWRGTFPPLAQPWRLPWWLLETHTGNMLAYPLGGRDFGSTFTFLMVVAGAAALCRGKGLQRQHAASGDPAGGRLALLLLGPLAFAFVAAAMRKYPYGGSARVMLYMAPAFCLLAGAGMAWCLRRLLPGRWVARGTVLAAGAILLVPAVGTAVDAARPYKSRGDEDNRLAIQDLRSRTAPGDRWVVFNSLEAVDWAPLLSSCGGEGARLMFHVEHSAPVPVAWSPDPAKLQPLATGRTWLLAYKHHTGQPIDEKLGRYVGTLSSRLGRPRVLRYELASPDPKRYPRPAVIEVYQFGPAGKLPR